MNIHNILNAIGNTPLVSIGNIYAKLEFVNPSGSVKDRAALGIITAAEKRGDIKPRCTIVEASSGNMGISLSMVALVKGYKMVVTMPEHMSQERKQMIKALGAELVLTSKQGGFKEAIDTAVKLARKPGHFHTNQYSNPDNAAAQQKIGDEILKQIGAVDAVVAGVGTGGTLMGMANALKKANPALKVIAVEPEECSAMKYGSSAQLSPHIIQGIGPGFIPGLVDMKCVDEVFTIRGEEALQMARRLCREHGLFCGISSGANMIAAQAAAKKYGRVATVLPDRAERYLSMGIFAP